MQVKLQGNFREMLNGVESAPSIVDFIQSEPNENEDKIINYLRNGIVIVSCGCIMADVINPKKGLAGCPEIKTDGIWAWSGDLEYYVKEYHLKLEEEFIKTMKENEWIIREDIQIDSDNIIIVSH